MPTQQDSVSLTKNLEYFADNDWYKVIQQELEHYRLIAASATHETATATRLLDIGNGGLFIYPIEHIREVEAIDVFVEDDFQTRHPTVKWTQMSALDMHFDRPFDTVIAVNTLHHIVDRTVRGTYANLEKVLAGVVANLEPGGKFILIESTVPAWFLAPYKMIFPLLLRIWPLEHPATFQFNFRDILNGAEHAGLELREFCWIPKTSDVLVLGHRIKRWMAPTHIGKFVFKKK